MRKDKVEIIDKSCGLSIIPDIDRSGDKCPHYHSTDCITYSKHLDYLNNGNISQTEVNELIDTELKDIDYRLDNLENINDNVKFISYSDYLIKTTLLSNLLSSKIDLYESNEPISPKYIEFYSNSKLDNVYRVNTTFTMNAYNKDGDEILSKEFGFINKVKKIYLFDYLTGGNEYDDIVKISIIANSPVRISENINVNIKFYYNKN